MDNMDNTWSLLGNYAHIMERDIEEVDVVNWAQPDSPADRHYVHILCVSGFLLEIILYLILS